MRNEGERLMTKERLNEIRAQCLMAKAMREKRVQGMCGVSDPRSYSEVVDSYPIPSIHEDEVLLLLDALEAAIQALRAPEREYEIRVMEPILCPSCGAMIRRE